MLTYPGTFEKKQATEVAAACRRGPAAGRKKHPGLVSDVLLSHGLPRSTIGARGLNFRVRNGTGCASPAMVADQSEVFLTGTASAVPSGPHSATGNAIPDKVAKPSERKSSTD